MATTNRTEYAILGLLADGPKSGYDIHRIVEQRLAHFWNESLGHLYPILRRLHERGWVEKRVEPGRSGPPRHEYSLTSEGRAALEEWFTQPIDPLPPRNELLLRIFLGRLADPAELIRTVAEYRDRRRADLDRFRGIAGQLEREAAEEPDFPFWMLTLRAGVVAAEAAVAWADEALERLDSVSEKNGPRSDDDVHDSEPRKEKTR